MSLLCPRFLFLSTGTLTLVYSTGSSCLWSDASQRQELNPARLDYAAPCHVSRGGGCGGSGTRPVLLSVRSWKWVAWGKENHLGGVGKQTLQIADHYRADCLGQVFWCFHSAGTVLFNCSANKSDCQDQWVECAGSCLFSRYLPWFPSFRNAWMLQSVVSHG